MSCEHKNNFRVLHSAALLSPPSGILNQMHMEQEAAEKHDIDWRVKMFCPMGSLGNANIVHADDNVHAKQLGTIWGKLFGWIKLRRNYHRWLLDQQSNYDVFLLRYYVHDPFQLIFIARCKKPVFFVHHTLEVPELSLSGGFRGFFRSLLEAMLGPPTISRAKGIVGVTQEIVDYEVSRSGAKVLKSYVYSNGIILKKLNLQDMRNLEIPELLFVANFAPWHGLDLILKSVKDSNENFVLHLVGKIPYELVELTNDPRVVVHGHLCQNEILALSSQCWIGLSAFALRRKKMKQACPLKVREYLMLGLPVVGNYEELFPKSFPHYKISDSNLSSIIKYAKDSRQFSKWQVQAESSIYIDKVILVKELHSFLKEK